MQEHVIHESNYSCCAEISADVCGGECVRSWRRMCSRNRRQHRMGLAATGAPW